ncbi:hypothetical protein GCM10023196_035530 [Actinoallomurus vinaceus]|uniref:Uncharacterized protein n=1 Tax=Actinoallomurus vinaceus TaxID=1080074 RepID=A0ABP8UAU0_9ACTN
MSDPSITIHGIPASVSRAQVAEAIRALGIDPTDVCGLSFDDAAVLVEVYASERPASTPAWRWTADGKDAATHRLTIPIVDQAHE